MKEFDVIIVGGGMIGLSLVVELSKKMELSIAIIDPNNCNPTINESFHTRVSAITPSTQDFLCSINVWDKIKRKKGLVSPKFGIKTHMAILISMQKMKALNT